MKIAFNPSTVAALITPPNNKDITFDLRGRNIFARGVKFCGTDTNTWRDIKINNVSIDSNILDLRNGSNTTLTNTNGVVTINSTWRPVVDNLTSDSTTSSLSANQGRVLAGLINTLSTNISNQYALRDGSNATGRWRGGLACLDVRDTNYTPYDLNMGLELHFFDNNTNNLKDGGKYNGVFSFRQWSSESNWTGGKAHQLSFTDNGNIWHRTSSGDDSWGTWKKLAYSTDIPSSLKNPYSLTTFGVVYDGSSAKTVTTSTFISQVTEGTSTITDGTMLITSYASNSGFADTNAVNVPYKRKAIHLWEYIKTKTDSLYATKGHNHDDRYLKLTGGTMTGSIAFSNSSYLLWNNGSYHQRIFLTDDSTADTAVFTFQQSSDSGVNWSNLMTIRDNGKVIANTFVGALQGNASTATKLTSSAGNAALPIYFSDGKPVACTASSIFSNLSNSGNNISVTVAGQNRTLTVGYATSAGYANGIANKGLLDSQEKIDNFITANRFEYATFKTTESNNVGFISNDGMILSIPWDSTSYGAQMAFDDVHSAIVKVRCKSTSWGNWYTLLHSGNYNSYSPTLTGTGASGTWDINITGNADTVDGVHVTWQGALTSTSHLVAWESDGSALRDINPADVTVGNSDTVDGYHVTSGNDKPWGTIPAITTSGQMDIGKHLEFHFDNTTGSDYSTILRCTGNYSNIIDLPSMSGTLALTSQIPNVTNYYWANIKISDTSNSNTAPTFGSAIIHTRLSIAPSTLTKTNPTSQQLVINGPYLDSNVTPGLKDWPGIGFHMPGKTWGSLIFDGNITAINSDYNGYVNYYGAGFRKNGSSDSYVLLGGGGHKVLSDFMSSTVKYALSDTIGGKALQAYKLYYSTFLKDQASIDNFREAYTFKCALWNGNSEGMGSSFPGASNGIILSGGYSSATYGFQLAIDDDPNYFIALRQRGDSTWSTWKRIPMGDGTGASGTWGINITGNSDTVDGFHANSLLTALSNSNNGISITVGGTTKSISNISVNYASSAGNADTLDGIDSTKFLRQVVVPNNTENDFNTFSNMTLTGRTDPTTGASLKNAPWSGSGPAGGYGVLTYLFSGGGYGTQMAWGYNSNRIYIRNKYWGGSGVGSVWGTSWDTLALTSDIPSSLKNPYTLTLKANGTTLAIYDGSSAKEANFTYANIGAASASHTHSNYVTDLGTSGNYLTWTKNGNTSNITVPYAGKTDWLIPQGFFSTKEQVDAFFDTVNYSLKVAYIENQVFSEFSDGLVLAASVPKSYCHQIHMDDNQPVIHHRARNGDGSGWSKWSKLLDSSNYSSYAIPVSASCNKNWSYNGQSDQPTWLWGTNDGTNCYVWNPSNFSVAKSEYSRSLLGRSTSGSDYGADSSNLVFAEWNTMNDSRWYLKATDYECRVAYANNAGNADTLDNTHLNGIFTAFGNNGHNITATIGGTTKSFLVNWAADSDKLDGYHASDLLTSVTNTNNGISVTVGGTTKSVSNISVNYATSSGNADTAQYLRSLGNQNCQTGRTQNYGDVYTYNTYANNTGAPTSYTSVIGFGRGIAGTVEIAGGWDNTNLYWRSLRDCCEDWYSWRTVLDSSNYTEFINNYYWANVKISTSSSTTTSPTVSNLTATSSIRMGNIYLQNTNEINSTSGIHLNYQNSGNISLCYGGGKVGIGTTSPTYKLDVNGDIHSSGTINCNALNVGSTLSIKDSVISCSASDISIESKESGSLLINSREVLHYDSDSIYMNNRIDLLHGLCFRTSILDTTYSIYTTDDVTVLIGVLRDNSSFKFRPAKDGQLLFLKIGKLYSDTYFWCTAENCVVVRAQDFGIYLDKNQNKDCFGDGQARIFIYVDASNRWYEFYCG